MLGDIVDVGVAIYRFSQGDIAGGFLSLGSAIPFVGWGFAALDIAREFNAPFLKDSILEKKRFDAQKEKEKENKTRRAIGGPFSAQETVVFNEDTPLPIEFTALTGGKVMTAAQMDRIKGMRTESGASNITFMELPMLDQRNKKPIPQSKPGDSRLSTTPDIQSTHGINHFISEFNVITELGEKV